MQQGARMDYEIYLVIANTAAQCDTLLSEVDSFKNGLYSTMKEHSSSDDTAMVAEKS